MVSPTRVQIKINLPEIQLHTSSQFLEGGVSYYDSMKRTMNSSLERSFRGNTCHRANQAQKMKDVLDVRKLK